MALARPRFEVADVVCAHLDEYLRAHPTPAAHLKVLKHITACRTAALGGHVDVCDACGHVRISYNSCRDRHCPKCQATRSIQWLTKRLERILPVAHFHVVFTIPAELNALALGNKKLVYGLLFAAASKTLLEIASDPKHLGAQIGLTAVLHTWGQNLMLHPHLHCLVTGGGLSADGNKWVAGRRRYLLPVKVLARVFRGKLLATLQRAYEQGKIRLGGSTADLADPIRWGALRDRLYRKDWVVYAKRPFGGCQQVLSYLGRYTHRVAISNHRIVDLANGKVTFWLKDYAKNACKKTLTLDAVEFLRRFLLHTLPHRFVRIRHYGLYAGRSVDTKLTAARQLLHAQQPAEPDTSTPAEPPVDCPWWERFEQLTGVDVMACPCCGGRLSRRQLIAPRTDFSNVRARASPLAA
jgi:hypothetical protein